MRLVRLFSCLEFVLIYCISFARLLSHLKSSLGTWYMRHTGMYLAEYPKFNLAQFTLTSGMT